jgi:magnesium transporter
MSENEIRHLIRDQAVHVDRGQTVEKTIDEVRGHDPEEGTTIYYAYVTENDELVGVVSMRELLNADDEQAIGEVMATDPVAVSSSDSLREAAQLFIDTRFPVLPVVDEGRFVGIVRASDLIDDLDETETKELFRSAWPWGAG